VPEIFSHQNDCHGRNQENGIGVKRGSGEFRESNPWRCGQCSVIDRLSQS